MADVLEATVADYYEKVFESYELREQARRFFERYDLLLTPTLPVSAFGAGVNVPPEQPYRNVVSWVCYTYPFHLTGDPAASTPCGFTADGLPVGLQAVAATNREAPAAPGRGLRVGTALGAQVSRTADLRLVRRVVVT